MIDKNELEDLFVRLKLGTLTIDNAIEEITKNIHIETPTNINNRTLWKDIEKGFDEVIFCQGRSYEDIYSTISQYINKEISFIGINPEENISTSLIKDFINIEYIPESKLLIYPKRSSSKPLVGNISIINPGNVHKFPLKQTQSILEVMGIRSNIYEMLRVFSDSDINSFNDKLLSSDLIIVGMSIDISLVLKLSYIYTQPIIVLPIYNNSGIEERLSIFSLMASDTKGVMVTKGGTGYNAALSAYRIINEKYK